MNCLQEFFTSAFKDIVSDELKKMKDQQSGASEVPSSLSGEDDVLWEYDGLHTADKGECEEILLEMQRIFYEDIRSELSQKGKLLPLLKGEVHQLVGFPGTPIALVKDCVPVTGLTLVLIFLRS